MKKKIKNSLKSVLNYVSKTITDARLAGFEEFDIYVPSITDQRKLMNKEISHIEVESDE